MRQTESTQALNARSVPTQTQLSPLATQRAELARETGEDENRFRMVAVDWSDLAGKTVILDLEIKNYEARHQASVADLGLEESLRQDPAYAGSFAQVMRLGSRRLLPPALVNALAAVEGTARKALADASYPSPFGRLVPRRAYPALRGRLLELQSRFYALRDDLVANFDAARAEMEETYRLLAKGAWRTSLAWNIPGDEEPPEAYVEAYVARALAKLPDAEQLAGRYSFSWSLAYLVLPSQLVADQELARLLAEQAEVERTRLALEQQGLQEQLDWATEEARAKRRLALEAEQERLNDEVQLAREVAATTAQARQEQVLAAIHTVSADLRGIIYEALTDVLASVKRNDRLMGRSVEQLKHLIERVRLLNFTDDAEVAAITGQLEAIVTVKAEQRNLPAIREKLGDIAQLLRADLFQIGRSVRSSAAAGSLENGEEEVPPLEQVRRMRQQLSEPREYALDLPEAPRRRRRGVAQEEQETGSLWGIEVGKAPESSSDKSIHS